MKSRFLLVASMCFTMLFVGCSHKSEAKVSYETLNDEYVQAVSPTFIGRLSEVKISFTKPVSCSESNLEKAVEIEPKHDGVYKLINENTVSFVPNKPFKANSKLTLSVNVNTLLGAKEPSPIYKHPFIVTGPTFDVSFNNLELNKNENSYSLSGKVKTDIPVAKEVIAGCLVAKLGHSKVNLVLKSSDSIAKELKEWDFEIPEITIGKKDRFLKVSYKGNKLGLNKTEKKAYSGKKEYCIPSVSSDFSVVDVNTSVRNIISVSFSKALDKAQDITEYVKLFNEDNNRIYPKITSTVNNNILTIYNDDNFDSVSNITLSNGIKSSDGVLLAYNSNIELSSYWDVPEIRFLTDGNILPTSQGTVVPIETKNLSGVLIQAFVVYNFNVNQFFQVNEYDDTRDMYRVGEPVWEKNLSFDWDNSMQNKFIPRGIDISELVKKYPGGMFQIRVSFRKQNIKYVCNNNHSDFSNLPMPPNTIGGVYKPREKSSWDYSEDYYYNGYNNYWSYRDDPCHPAFYTESYNHSCTISRNVFVSDIGLMAKLGANGKLFINAADLRSSEPLSGVQVSLYSFVGSKLAEGKTDKAGRIIFENAETAFMVAASNGKQTSYLKIGNGTALSTSHFETGGVVSENGIKGFIYGERGVWRPGDNIYLTFVLQDLTKSLPSNIPVIFTLTDPLGHELEKRTLSQSLNGFYPITTKTLSDSVTGLWNAKVKIGGKEWNKSLRVETVVPNKLSVELEVENGYLSSGTNNFTLKGAWLYGAPTPNYEADVTVSFTQGTTTFDGYSEYTFTNPNGFVETSKETIYDGYLDSDSTLRFSQALDAGRNLPGKLKAHFISRIFEPSGVPSTSSSVFEYSPYSRYVGIKLPKGDESRNMLLTDVKHTADVVLVDEKGNKISYANLDYAIYHMDWKWWWEKDAYTSATYIGSRSYSKIADGTVNIKDGRGSFNFEVKYPSWGRYLIQVRDGNSGHVAGKVVYIDWPGWAGRSQEEGSGSTAMLPLAVDKKQYKVGDVAKISFASTKGERALATIEKGGNIIGQKWIETTDGTTVYELPLKDNMAPNVYVHITLLQPHLQTMNSLPIRLYGVVPVMVDNPETLLQPVITCKDTFEPSSETSISVSEKNGKPMTYTIAVVDEGLLGLTAFKAPNLRNEFYQKEASLIENWDLYKYVMNAYSGKLETLLAIGGSEEIVDNSENNSNRFTPVIKFFGPYYLKAGEKKVTTFDMPNYMGAVRTMVIAGNEGAYGVAEKTTPVKSDLILLPSVPRTLGLNEEIAVPVTIFNGTNKKTSVTVSINSKGAINMSDKKTFAINPNENDIVYFKVSTANAKEGIANMEFKAVAGSLTQNNKMDVKVESRGIPVTYHSDFTLKGNSSEKVTVPSPSEKGSTTLSAEITTLPLVNLDNRVKSLIEYPHGCIEQITSGGFPQLFITDFVKFSKTEIDRITSNVNSVIERYPQYQNINGSFSYWPGGNYAHLWGSTYAAHFMTEAKRRGYSVPDSLYKPLINWLAESTQGYGGGFSADESIDTQVYRLYVLALAGYPDIGSMNRIKDDVNSDTAKLLLASSYALCGRKDSAKELVKNVKFSSAYYRRSNSVTFDSSLRNQSIALLAFTNLSDGTSAGKYAKSITEILNSDKWLSTQETAWALFTLLPYYETVKSERCEYGIDCNGTTLNNILDTKTAIINLPAVDSDKQTAVISNKSKQILYGTLSTSGKSIPGTEVEKSDGLRLSVDYSGTSYYAIKNGGLQKGDTFELIVEIANRSGSDVNNIAVTVPVPTAWEFTNDRLTSDNDSSSSYTYQDIKDDYIYTYLDLRSGESRRFTFSVTVAYDGKYYVPAIHAEAMYDNDISAIVPGIYVNK